MTTTPRILIESLEAQDILALSDEQMDELIFTAEAIVFQVGSAQILGEFRIQQSRLLIELAQIEGGGEGVLLTLWVLAEKYARKRGLREIEWVVHAVNCATPNLKLQRFLDKRGFSLRPIARNQNAYCYTQKVI